VKLLNLLTVSFGLRTVRLLRRRGSLMNDILFGNNNKKIIKKLSNRNFHANKIRNVAAILAIAMTAFLFTAVISLALGMQSSLMLTLQMQKGSKADGDIRYMTETQYKALVSSDFVEQAGCRQIVGFATNAPGHTIEIDYADSVQQELTFCTPTHGTAPQAANEITTTELALKALGVKPEIGAKVPIEFELRGQTYQFDMVVSGWWEASDSSVSLMIVSNSFMEENREMFPNTFSADREITGTYLSDVVLKNKTDVKGQLEEFARSAGGEPSDMNAGNYVLCASNSVMTSTLQPSSVLAIVCFLFLFAVCGYLLIYNIFDISVIQDIQQYGLLRTIGTSTRQVKRLVNMLAIKLTLIALPVGLILGYLISSALLPVVMSFLSDYNTAVSAQIPLSPFIFIITALFTIFTVYVSTRRPAKKHPRFLHWKQSDILSRIMCGKSRQNGEKEQHSHKWRFLISVGTSVAQSLLLFRYSYVSCCSIQLSS
ncbi:MAG: ABC transporter permease, partial [Paludibacter sp.]|nr:ABC transporter permease [Paludibacter sp.]